MSSVRTETLADGVTLYCGNCLDVLPTIGVIDTLITDPPYGMAFRSNHRAVRHEAIANDSNLDALLFACSVPVAHSRYVFCRWDNLADVPKPRSCVTWVKNNWSMGDLEHEHARQTESILFYPGPGHFWPRGRPQDVISAPRTGNDNHPTEKPVGLMRSIVDWTAGTVCDPFAGSGTTGVAAVKAGRPFVGIEIDPVHFATACRRISEALKQPDMFIERPAPAKQEALL